MKKSIAQKKALEASVIRSQMQKEGKVENTLPNGINQFPDWA